jgi:hypothetical protein
MQITHRQITGFGFVFGFEFKGNGADRKSQGSGERDGEKLYPHGVASSLAGRAGESARENAPRRNWFLRAGPKFFAVIFRWAERLRIGAN